MSAQSLRASLLVILSQSGFLLVLQFIASLFIARLLTPTEIGIFSVSMVLISLASTLRDFGVVDYLVQEKQLDEGRMRAAGFVSYAVSWLVASLIALLAPLAADFYGVPEIRGVMYLLAVNFLFLPLGTIAMAYMRRERLFNRIAAIRTARGLIQSMGGVLLAWQGFSFYSMALSGILAALLVQIMIWRWWPPAVPRRPHWRGTRAVLGFGGYSTAASIIKDLDKGAPDMVLGRVLDMVSVAYFGRASGLIGTFNRLVVQVTSFVALPHFAKSMRDQNQDANTLFLQSLSHLTGIAWPFMAFLGIFSWLVIPVLYGPQWDAAIPLLFWLCVGELFLAPYYLQGTLLIAQGQIKAEALRSLLLAIVKIPPLLLLGSYGLEAIAQGYAAACLLAALITQGYAAHLFGTRLLDTARALWRSVVVLLLTSGCLWLGSAWLHSAQLPSIWALPIALLFTSLLWLIAIFITQHPLSHELSKALRGLAKQRPVKP